MATLASPWRLSITAALLAIGVGACGDTWRGAKQDTRENIEATGEGVEDSGEWMKRQVD